MEASATVTITPLVNDMLGGGPLTVGAHSDVVRAVNNLEIAMVLDNTGSMAGTKLSTLKTAASNFVDTLSTAAARSSDPNAVRIALGAVLDDRERRLAVPVADLDRPERRLADQRPDLQHPREPLHPAQADERVLGGCVESRQAPYDVQDTPPTPTRPRPCSRPFSRPTSRTAPATTTTTCRT
ncbi:MAG: hypothetical protein WDM92_04430 [Caulobacteraceae bacterium]